MITSDASVLAEMSAGLPIFLTQSHYSKKYETEADQFAFELMLKTNINPMLFANILSRISIDNPAKKEQNNYYFSSHPSTKERLQMAEKYTRKYKNR